MKDYVRTGNLQVARVLYEFINAEALPGSGLTSDQFWAGLEALIRVFAPQNQALLVKREELESKINAWHKKNRDSFDFSRYKAFLKEIAYLEPEGEDFQVNTQGVDDEIALQAGPQLVVPATNARYAINAANARWGSLYDALYGTDAIGQEGGAYRGETYNPERDGQVIAYAREFLDQAAPLMQYSHKEAVRYAVVNRPIVGITLPWRGRRSLLPGPYSACQVMADI